MSASDQNGEKSGAGVEGSSDKSSGKEPSSSDAERESSPEGDEDSQAASDDEAGSAKAEDSSEAGESEDGTDEAASAKSESSKSKKGEGSASSKKKSDKKKSKSRFAWLDDLRKFSELAYGVDHRSLALFRLCMGLLVVSDVYHRSLHMEAHYTDAGFMPRDRLLGGWSQPLFFSLHNWGGNMTSQVILFAITGIFGVMLVIGFKTRLSVFMCWLMVCSVQGRNYLILQGGDDLLRVMLFWSMFVPLATRFSVDSVLAKPPSPARLRALEKPVFSIATNVLVLQLLAMYTVSAILKTGPTWHQQGSAIHLALHHHAFATPFGMWFRELPRPILQYMTWGTWWLELAGPLLFFFPFKTEWARTFQVMSFVGFHFGLFLTMELGHFPWVAMAYWMVVLPKWFWDTPVAWARKKAKLGDKWTAWGEKVEKWIRGHREWFWTPHQPRQPRIYPKAWVTLLVTLIALYATHGTVYAATHKGDVQGRRFDPLLMMRLYANWGMFAPNPPSESGWFVFQSKLKNGTEVDVWRDGAPVDWSMPEVPSATYKTQRWRKFGDNILMQNHAVVRPYFLRWLCNDWNKTHKDGETVVEIELFHMKQSVRWPYKGYTALTKNSLRRQRCPTPPKETKPW